MRLYSPSSPSRRRFVRDAATGAVLLLGGAGSLLLPAGCNHGNNDGGDGGQVGTSPASGGSASVNTEGRKAGTLRYALSTEPTTLDPARVSDGPTIDVLQQIYE